MLKLEHINKSFSGVKVLRDVSLHVRKGSCFGLVGANGAGKSTLMNIIGGVHQKDSGTMFFNGNAYSPATPQEAQKAGIAFIHQELNLFTNLSVAENIFIDDLPKTKLGSIDWKRIRRETKKQFESMHFKIDPHAKISDLPMGQRQMVEVAKAFIKNAELIIFDEPTTSLSNAEKQVLFSMIQEIKAQKKTIIYISHILEDLFQLCDEIAVLRDGVLVNQGPVSGYTVSRIASEIVGKEISNSYPSTQRSFGGEILRVEDLAMGSHVHGVSFNVRSGEIVGLYGLMGAGRTETANTIFGMDAISSGNVYFEGEKLDRITPRECIRRKIAYVTENRREEGLLNPKTVNDNLSLVTMGEYPGKLFSLDFGRMGKDCDGIVDKLSIKTTDPRKQIVNTLSGGNQQKVVIGKWMLAAPKLFILDEPTRGIDVGAKYDIYLLINELAAKGTGVLFISSEMDELIGTCDRILVMHTGRIVANVTRQDFDEHKIMEYALGGVDE